MNTKGLFNKVSLSAVILAAGIIFSSCLNDGNDSIILENGTIASEPPTTDSSISIDNIITINNAEYQEGSMPAATSNESIGTVAMNSQALSGGGNFVSITSPNDYDIFYVSVEGTNGYYIVTPSSKSYNPATGMYTYQFTINFTENFNSNIIIILSGVKKETGEVTQPEQNTVVYVESRTGDLDINLVFENEKDIDLHLYTPTNEHIYYGNRGGYNESGQIYGLDKDSNPGCHIDGLNNENIFIPYDLIQPGEYIIKVNMFANCNTRIATSWSVTVRYQGQLIENNTPGYGNPATGTYPVNAPSGDNTTVFTFYLSPVQAAAVRAKAQFATKIQPILPTDMDLLKIEQEKIDLSLKNAR